MEKDVFQPTLDSRAALTPIRILPRASGKLILNFTRAMATEAPAEEDRFVNRTARRHCCRQAESMPLFGNSGANLNPSGGAADSEFAVSVAAIAVNAFGAATLNVESDSRLQPNRIVEMRKE